MFPFRRRVALAFWNRPLSGFVLMAVGIAGAFVGLGVTPLLEVTRGTASLVLIWQARRASTSPHGLRVRAECGATKHGIVRVGFHVENGAPRPVVVDLVVLRLGEDLLKGCPMGAVGRHFHREFADAGPFRSGGGFEAACKGEGDQQAAARQLHVFVVQPN